jgi:bacterioferritin
LDEGFMKGDADIIQALNEILTAELTAINQYFIHARMCANWGYDRLAAKKREESIEEMHDAQKVIDRILYLDGVPNMQKLNPIRIGEDVVEQHKSDLKMEIEAAARYNKAIALCRDKGDNGTREILAEILRDEEKSIDWLESQLHIIDEIGKERYLAEQIHG